MKVQFRWLVGSVLEELEEVNLQRERKEKLLISRVVGCSSKQPCTKAMQKHGRRLCIYDRS